MATSKTRKVPTKSKAAKGTKTAKPKSPRRTRSAARASDSPNYLLVGSDGRLVLQSGRTGEILDIDPALRPQIEALLQKRQQVGIELSKLLEENGLDVASSIPVFFDD